MVQGQSSQRQRVVPTGSKINFKLLTNEQRAAIENASAERRKAAADSQHDKLAELAKSCLQEPLQKPLSSRDRSSKPEQDRFRPPNSQRDTPALNTRSSKEASDATPKVRRRRQRKRGRSSLNSPSGGAIPRDTTLQRDSGSRRSSDGRAQVQHTDHPTAVHEVPRAKPQAALSQQKQGEKVLELAEEEALPQATAASSLQEPQQRKRSTAREYLDWQRRKISSLEDSRQQLAEDMAALQSELAEHKACLATAQPQLVILPHFYSCADARIHLEMLLFWQNHLKPPPCIT